MFYIAIAIDAVYLLTRGLTLNRMVLVQIYTVFMKYTRIPVQIYMCTHVCNAYVYRAGPKSGRSALNLKLHGNIIAYGILICVYTRAYVYVSCI